MENIRDVIKAVVAILIFLTASGMVFLIIHTFSHVVGGFSLFVIAVIAVVSFCTLILVCSYLCGVKSFNGVIHSTRGDDPRNLFNGVSVIQVPYRYERAQSTDESPWSLMRVYSSPWNGSVEDPDLPPYIDDPPPDYFTATGKRPDGTPIDAASSTAPLVANATSANANEGNGETVGVACSSKDVCQQSTPKEGQVTTKEDTKQQKPSKQTT